MKKFYVTTAIDYVNSLPHLGTAYEKIGADAIARYHRMEEETVHLQMGSDEHSTNVKKEAVKKGLPPKKYCDEMRKEFVRIWKSLAISFDGFIQTSEPRHHRAVGQLFQKILNKGEIYKAPYEGWYCESCEAFFTEKDLVDGKCPSHKSEPKWLKEENYFFRLSAYQERLLHHYKKHPEFILPEIRRNEVLRLVEGGLQDISVSRASFDWGIPLPGDKSHVVYVWFDALINYLTATGFGQGKRRAGLPAWPADLHIIGKDITRFHCVIWPAMLMSAGLPLPKTVFAHGFVSLKGEKMSKTLGNIVTPLEIVPTYGSDALRYYLLRSSSFGSDGDFTWEDFIKRYNSDLANDLGNLLNRTLGMANRYLGGKISDSRLRMPDGGMKAAIGAALKAVRSAMDYRKGGDLEFHKALEAIWEVVHAGNKFIDSSAPWKLAKGNQARSAVEGKAPSGFARGGGDASPYKKIGQVLYNTADALRNIALLIAPFLPKTSEEIWRQLGLGKKLKWERQRFAQIGWGKTPPVKVKQGRPIFPRIDLVGAKGTTPVVSLGTGGSDASVAGVRPPALSTPVTSKGLPSQASARASSETPGTVPLAQQKQERTMELDITDFQKLDLRVAEVRTAERIEGTDKLLKLQIDLGGESRQIVAGIAPHYAPEQLIGKGIVVVVNLKPVTIRGVESRGMLLAASNDEGLSIVTLDRAIAPGARVK